MTGTVTFWLRFADEAAALVAFAAAGLTVGSADPETGEVRTVVPSPGYRDGVRFDVVPVGGDGVYRVADGAEAMVVDGVATEVQRTVARPGYHVDFVWHGDRDTAPDFRAFIATTSGDWSYSGTPATDLS